MGYTEVIAQRKNKIVYRDGDKCIKVFSSDYSKVNVLNEAMNHARVEETGVRIPKLYEVTTVDGNWCIVSEYIEGVTLAELMHRCPEKYDEYLEQLVDIQNDYSSRRCYNLNNLREKVNHEVCSAELESTTRFALHMRIDAMPRRNNLCHGDFNPTNVILQDDGTPVILDWAHATQGNATADAARTYLYFLYNGEKETAEKYLHLFCARAKETSYEYFRKWVPVVAAGLSTKGSPEERSFMLAQVGIVGFE